MYECTKDNRNEITLGLYSLELFQLMNIQRDIINMRA